MRNTGRPVDVPWFRWALSNRVPSSCPVRRIPRQDPLHTTGWESLNNGWYTTIQKDKVKANYRCISIMRHYFLLTNPSTGGNIQFIFYWNWMMTVFSLHISATLHLTIFGIWSNNIQSVQYVICVMIVRGLWYLGLAILYTIWIVAHLCTSWGTFLRINGKTTLSPLDATATHRWRCSSCQS